MRMRLILLAALLTVAACEAPPTSPTVPDGQTRLRVYANVANTNVESVTLRVAGEGGELVTATTLEVRDGVIDGTLVLPVGIPIRIEGVATGPGNTDQLQGAMTIELAEGEAAYAELLLAGAASQAVKVKLGAVILVVRPAADTLMPGESATFTARFLDANGGAVKGTVEWGSFDLSFVSIDRNGVALAREAGHAEIAAVGSGLAGSAYIWICTRLECAEAAADEAFRAWHTSLGYWGPGLFLSTASAEHASPWANAGMEYYSRIPRQPTANNPDNVWARNLTEAWTASYAALTAARRALQLIEGSGADAETMLRFEAYGKYVQGLALGTVALLYDQGYVLDENTDTEVGPFLGYSTLMTRALQYLGDAASLAQSGSFTIQAEWMGQDVSSGQLARLARSEMARMRANVARTPAERAAVNWAAVVADANAGVQQDWDLVSNCAGAPPLLCDEALQYRLLDGWHMQNNWIGGMADQSGAFQAWIAAPYADKLPFLVMTPDTRWPQGPDEATQAANPGDQLAVRKVWSRPDRGTWRWSYYDQRNEPFYSFANQGGDPVGSLPLVTVRELEALVAEANYRSGALGPVATFVNETRTAHGLNATNASGLNSSCVPKLPDGTCGGLWEMLKWEKRLVSQFAGPLRVGWYFDGRGWGDLMEGTVLQLPVPWDVMEALGETPYDFGGVGGLWGAPVGTYGY